MAIQWQRIDDDDAVCLYANFDDAFHVRVRVRKTCGSFLVSMRDSFSDPSMDFYQVLERAADEADKALITRLQSKATHVLKVLRELREWSK